MRLSLQSFDIFQNDQLVIFNYISLPLDAHFINYIHVDGLIQDPQARTIGGGGREAKIFLNL